jgi:hypothetical protein
MDHAASRSHPHGAAERATASSALVALASRADADAEGVVAPGAQAAPPPAADGPAAGGCAARAFDTASEGGGGGGGGVGGGGGKPCNNNNSVQGGSATPRVATASEATPAAGATAKAAVPTVARRAGDGAAMLRVVGKAMQFFAPQAKWALAACFLPLPVNQRTPPHDDGYAAQLTISVEAVGSGLVIVPALQVNRDTTVGVLKALIEGRCVPVSSGAIRVFVGHGGEELADDLQSMRAAAVADGATLVLVRISPQETLLRLCEATGGGRWHRQSGWGPSSTALLSAWQGVKCNGAGDVVTLTLTNNNLRGACVQGAKNARLDRTACVRRPHAEPLGCLACFGALCKRAYEFPRTL